MSYFRKRRPAIYVNTGEASSSFVAAADGPAASGLKEALTDGGGMLDANPRLFE